MEDIELIYGEALEKMDMLIERGVVVDFIPTDLPYGTTNNPDDIPIAFKPMWERIWKLLKPNGCVLLFSDGLFTSRLKLSQEKFWRYDRVWDKKLVSGFLNANRMPVRKTETMCIFYKKLPTYNPQKVPGKKPNSRGQNKPSQNSNYGVHKVNQNYEELNHPTSLISIQKPHPSKAIHPTEKPVALIEELVLTYTQEGDTVLDFCCGAGATVIACKNTNRKVIGIDKGYRKKPKMVNKIQLQGKTWIEIVKLRLNGDI